MNAAMNSPGIECDGHSVGVIIIRRKKGIISRKKGVLVLVGDIPGGSGTTGVGGHVFDMFKRFAQAARREVREEMGLWVLTLRAVFERPVFRLNPCKRGDAPHGQGHYWQLYIARTAGRVKVDPRSFVNVRWVDREELQRLADRSLAFVRGEVSRDEWERSPGLALTWVRWFVAARLISMSAADLREIETAMEAGVARP